ncbi:PREDICTED: mas-related G-protein coupled receptor member X2-like [Hipposideros armiger]|uniref:Mas-related G-protein coupled receptor member X2-like n=1 Tax=Hipposideros armiger TaxID=186990 RepID=A0A8B7S2Q9_HIPAR|nr:PREDICTED: mas-related G-protein coupled receptor member X2-like [Hipposideros armiger]
MLDKLFLVTKFHSSCAHISRFTGQRSILWHHSIPESLSPSAQVSSPPLATRMKECDVSGGLPSMNATVIAWSTALTPTNESNQAIPKCDPVMLIPALPVFIISLIGLAGNTVVLWILSSHIRRNTFSVYILNLAGADFLFLCCQIICSLEILIKYFHSISIGIPCFLITVSIFAYVAGLSLLSAISTERCLSVLCPIWYRFHRPRHMSAIMCALPWTLCLLLSTLNGNYCGFLFRNRDKDWCQAFDFIILGWLIFLFVLLSGSSLALVTRLLCGSQRVQLTRLYVTVLLTVLVCLLCGLPFGFKWFLWYWMEHPCSMFSHFLKRTGIILASLNSSANPIIYFFVGSFRQQWKQQHTLKLVLQRALEDVTEEQKSRGSLPQETRKISRSNFM